MIRSTLSILILAGMAWLLSACSSAPTDTVVTLEPTTPIPSAAVDEPILSRISSLGQVSLADNSCGLFLWSRIGQDRVLVTVLQNDVPGAMMRLDGRPQRLEQTLTEGRAYYGIFEKTYLRRPGLEVELTLDHNAIAGLPQGATVKRASMRLTDTEGFTLALPLAGLIACQTPGQK